MPTPCDTCTKCKNPGRCGNVDCQDWHDWFVGAWNTACAQLRELLNKKKDQEERKDNDHGK